MDFIFYFIPFTFAVICCASIEAINHGRICESCTCDDVDVTRHLKGCPRRFIAVTRFILRSMAGGGGGVDMIGEMFYSGTVYVCARCSNSTHRSTSCLHQNPCCPSSNDFFFSSFFCTICLCHIGGGEVTFPGEAGEEGSRGRVPCRDCGRDDDSVYHRVRRQEVSFPGFFVCRSCVAFSVLLRLVRCFAELDAKKK